MADISEAEAILHLKRALGEIEAGDSLPAPLPPVQKPKPTPPPPKQPKTAPQPNFTPAAPPVQPSIGPTPRNEVRQPTSTPAPPPKPRQQQPPVRPQGGAPPQPPGQVAGPAGMQGFLSHGLDQPGMKNVPGAPFGAPLGGMPQGPLPPGMPGLPGAAPPGQVRPHGKAAPGGGAAAAAAAAAAAPGKDQKQFEIPQSKVGLVIGKNSATLNAIKAYSKAQCFIEQNTPEEDKALVFVVGTAKEVAKCKQTVKAVVDGSMSVSTLFTLAGMTMPRGGVEEWEPPRQNATAAAMAPGNMAHQAPPWGMHPGMMTAPPMPTGAAPTLPPMMLAAATAGAPSGPVPTGIPGMPENQQMQQNLNDYYARWWSTYASQQQADKEGGGADAWQEEGDAFDKDALLRLAERAAKGLPEEPAPAPASIFAPPGGTEPMAPPGPPPEPAGGVCSCGQPFPAGANFCSSCGSKLSKPAPPPEAPGAPGPNMSAASPAPPPQHTALGDAPSSGSMSSVSAISSQAGQTPRGPITLKGFLRPAEPLKPKKDDDALANMMERLHGNVAQTKQAMAMNEVTPQPRQQVRGTMMGMMAGEEDPRTRADFEFEALMSRMQAAQAVEEVEHVGREVLIRFPAYNPQQVVDLLQKVGTSALQSYQNGDFLAELCRSVLPRLKEFNSTQFTSLTSTMAQWTRRPDGPKTTRFQDNSKAFFSGASVEMSTRLMNFAPHELNCCLAAFVSVGFSEHKFFASVGRAALARHSSYAPVQLTALLAILSEIRLVHTDLFNASAAFLSTRTGELRPVDMSRVLRSFAKCGLMHQVLCKAVGDEVVRRASDKSATVTFKAEEMCEITWALCAMQHFHAGVIRLMFKSLEKVPTVACDALLQVYEIHLALDIEHRESYARFSPERHVIDALEDHYKDNRKDQRQCSEKMRNDVASTLKSLVDGSVHVNHRTSLGLLVDVVALRKRSSTDGFIHIDLDSNVTTVRSLDQDEPAQATLVTEGTVGLRRRLLQKQGLRLVTVRESEWRDLDDSKEKRRYLRNLLANLGDVLQ